MTHDPGGLVHLPIGSEALEKYLGVEPLKPFIPLGKVLEKMVPFRLPEDDS